MGLMFQHQAAGRNANVKECVKLFEQNFNPKNDDEQALSIDLADFEQAWPMAKELFVGAVKRLGQLDRDIGRAAKNWRLTRISPVDLSLLRLAYYEMLYRDDIPLLVSLNEAIEIAKSFGDNDSFAFINGILDKLLEGVKAPSTAPPKVEGL
jgi:N utilization substance protein B